MSFYQVCDYLDRHMTNCKLCTVKLRNGKRLNNSTYDRDFGKSDGYFKTFAQLFYIMPQLTRRCFTCIDNGYEVIVHEL